MKKPIVIVALAAVAAVSLAQQVGKNRVTGDRTAVSFVEVPGQMEFSGEMIVRPKQAEQLARLGVSEFAAQVMHRKAELMIAEQTVNVLDKLDIYVLKVPANMNENTYSRQLLATGLFQYAEPNWTVYPVATPNDPLFGTQWGHQTGASNSINGWDVNKGDGSKTVTVTDTGIRLNHQEWFAAGRRVAGGNTATGVWQVEDGTGSNVTDLNGHGTHCSGIACAQGNNSLGVAGVNWDGTKIRMIRVSNSAGGSSSIAALTLAMQKAADLGSTTVSTSYSGVTSAGVDTAGTYAFNLGCNSFWAAGNAGSVVNTGDWANVSIIGATQSGNTAAGFSNRGLNIDVFAPGAGINSTWNSSDSSYTFLDGTSMACPFAAGLDSLLASENPSYSAARRRDVQYRTAVTMGASATFGWGRVNVYDALGHKPDNVSFFRGSIVSGNVASLYSSQDSDFIEAKKGITVNAAEAPIQMDNEYTVAHGTANCNELNIKWVTRSSVAGSFQETLYLWNWTTSVWDQVATDGINTAFGTGEYNQTTNLANYINASLKVRTRLAVKATGPVSINDWRVHFNQMRARTLRATE